MEENVKGKETSGKKFETAAGAGAQGAILFCQYIFIDTWAANNFFFAEEDPATEPDIGKK